MARRASVPADAKTVDCVELYSWLPIHRRLDVLPFIFAYSLWLLLAFPRFSFTDASLVLGAVAVLHILTFLLTVWSVDFRCFAHARKVRSVHEAQICKVVPAKFCGSKEIVPIFRRPILPSEKQLLGQDSENIGDLPGVGSGQDETRSQGVSEGVPRRSKRLEAAAAAAKSKIADPSGNSGAAGGGAGAQAAVAAGGVRGLTAVGEEIRFTFRKQHFVYFEKEGGGEGEFRKLGFPSKLPLGVYGKWKGYGSHAKVEAAASKWGVNRFDFPQPTFLGLYKEQCTEPFFVFQVFCVGLWCLDEYWYYSIFTLFMLLLFESTVVTSRLRTLKELRSVRVDHQTIPVHRGGKWIRLSGHELLPGDIVSIGRSSSSSSTSSKSSPSISARTANGAAPNADPSSSPSPSPSDQTASSSSGERSVPADMLLIAGTAIVNEALLTGESTPQWKGPPAGRELHDILSVRRDKAHVLFGGTKIVQHTADKSGSAPLKTPDGGCLAVVLRTGFDTSQGKLMRTILFSSERVTANSWESGFFILFLLCFALVASAYVLMKGLEDGHRSRYKLFLNCTLIITSVIPPELPMELSIAVNTSLIALMRKGVFCTEPFRIPFAGKVDVCCFDKTGTLTSDDMQFRGVAGVGADNGDSEVAISDPSSLPLPSVLTLAACHSLVYVDHKTVGDPLEKAAVTGVDWAFTGDDRAVARKGAHHSAQILQRHHFASHLKRMAVVVKLDAEPGFMALVKGAPETLLPRIASPPPHYSSTFKRFTRQGARVLALAYKQLPDMTVSEVRAIERDEIESGLTFAGFAVFACPLRGDSAEVLAELKHSSHKLVMITGDQPLTACHVAAQVHITSQDALILTPAGLSDQGDELASFHWVSPDEQTKLPFDAAETLSLTQTFDLCIDGIGLGMLQREGVLQETVPLIKVFARVSPDQKEVILNALKDTGHTTLMCGDGTNDVGALKQAHIGVALLNALPPAAATPATADKTSSSQKGAKSKSGGTSDPSSSHGLKSLAAAEGRGAASRSTKSATTESEGSRGQPLTPLERHQQRVKAQQEKLERMMKKLQEEGEAGGDGRSAPMVKLGDASMAAAFTAKHSSVRPTADILRQGRATLVTTLQMFKILGLNCLATAYVLSVMYLDGVKLGDTQATISGMFTAAFFLFVSQAKPMPRLSPQRPHTRVFGPFVLISILGQWAIHMAFLIGVVGAAQKHMPEECIEPDAPFSPNLVNTVSYTANMMIQVATFAVNYIGHPFNQSIYENKPFFYALSAAAVFFTAVASDLFRELNDGLDLVPLPQPLGFQILSGAAAMVVGCFIWESFLRWCFPGPAPPKICRLTGKGKRHSGSGGQRQGSAAPQEKTVLEKKFD